MTIRTGQGPALASTAPAQIPAARSSTVRIIRPTGWAGTMEMPSRPAPISPIASTVHVVPNARPANVDRVLFEGERLARLDDFVRLRFYAERVTFVALLSREGITPEYYAQMCERFDVLRRREPDLDAAYNVRLGEARKYAGKLATARGG
jgi:hypothetical protein